MDEHSTEELLRTLGTIAERLGDIEQDLSMMVKHMCDLNWNVSEIAELHDKAVTNLDEVGGAVADVGDEIIPIAELAREMRK